MAFINTPIPLKLLENDDSFIWYHKHLKETYKVTKDERDVTEALSKYLIHESNLASNYNSFIMDGNEVNIQFLNEIILGFGSSNLTRIFEDKQNNLFNNMVTYFVITSDKNSHLIENLNDLYFFKQKINHPAYENTIRLIAMNATQTIGTQDLANNIGRKFTTYHYGNENKFFVDDLSEGTSLTRVYVDLLFIGNGEETTVYFPETITVLDIVFKSDYSDNLKNSIEVGDLIE